MKPHELALARAILAAPPPRAPEYLGGRWGDVRDLIRESGLVPKQCWRVLEKWCGKRWYDFGVCIDLGWLTPEGRAALQAAVDEEEGR